VSRVGLLDFKTTFDSIIFSAHDEVSRLELHSPARIERDWADVIGTC